MLYLFRMDRLLSAIDVALERAMRILGPIFICAAVALVSMCAWVFVDAVYGEVRTVPSLAMARREFCNRTLVTGKRAGVTDTTVRTLACNDDPSVACCVSHT